MRRFMILAGAVLIVFVLLGIASSAAIAKTGPFMPGTPLFPLQNFSEQVQARLQSPVERQVEAYFLLAERRIENLVTQTGSPHELESLTYLETALDQAVQAWTQLPVETADSLREQIKFLLKASEIAVAQLTVAPSQNPEQVAAFLAKMDTLQTLAATSGSDSSLQISLAESDISNSPADVSEQASLPEATIDPLSVPFPEGSVASQHAFFPLMGQHAQIECEECHIEGVYDGTAAYCEACHASMKPNPHYEGDCAACHSAFSWSEITFDHTLVTVSNCVSCHQADKPANHFGNQCAACHSTHSWQGANFDHQAAGATDCKACHTDDKPANHFSGQCSACHTTNSWQGANFNHQAAGATDCKACHADDKPTNHFGGQCSACHTTNKWEGASFSHNGQTDCKACHSGDKPGNHFSGQCSACHSTNDWDAEFSHSGQTDCKACHANDRPDDHNNGQCSECHNTNDWDDADDDEDDDDDGEDDGEEDDDDGDDDGDDDKQGNLNPTSIQVAANFRAPLECSSCHATGKTILEAPTPGSTTPWWQNILTRFQNMVPRSIG